MWVLGISALVGNIYVVTVRILEKKQSPIQAKQSYLITNLAISDSIMGIYMVILASVDVYYGQDYFLYSDQWRSSALCKVASVLSLLSSEGSILFITLISFDRFLSLVFPFSDFKLGTKHCKIITVVIWLLSATLGIVPTIMAGPDSDFYDLSDVCIGLPLITRPSSFRIESESIVGKDSLAQQSFTLPVADEYRPAWYFSIAIFLGLNLVCFMGILCLYIAIFINVRIVRKKANTSHDDELAMAIKMAAIVGTDFLCWMPVIIMGILSQTGVAVIPLEAFTWSVVFILPINSAINPYLYTIATMISDSKAKKNKAAGHDTVVSKSGNKTKSTNQGSVSK